MFVKFFSFAVFTKSKIIIIDLIFFAFSSFLLDSNFWYWFSATLVCFFNSFPNGVYSNLLIEVAFSSKSFSGKLSFPVKNSFLLRFPDDKADLLAVCLSKLYWALFYSILWSIVLVFSIILIFIISFF